MADPGRGSACAWWTISIVLVGSACSGGGGGPPAAQIPTLAVVDVFPADGAQAIDPRTEVRVRFSELVSGPIDLWFVVADAAGPVPGLVDGSPDGRTWRWLPLYDLPRGGRIELRARAGHRWRR